MSSPESRHWKAVKSANGRWGNLAAVDEADRELFTETLIDRIRQRAERPPLHRHQVTRIIAELERCAQ